MSGATPSSAKRLFVGADDIYASQVPADDLLHVAGRYAPILRVRSTATADSVIISDAVRIDVRMFGAVGDGVTNDTAAVQAALSAVPSGGGIVLLPAGSYLVNATLLVKSRTLWTGDGTLVAAPLAQWTGSTYRIVSNVNHEASSITDTDITLDGITIDVSGMGSSDGLNHCIRIRKARRVVIRNCTMIGGASSVALLGCDDTLEQGNSYVDFYNCGSDHWDNPSNARVVGCHIQTTSSAQMVNFNPEPSDLIGTGHVAKGFTMTGCVVISTEANATACQIEPLTTGNRVEDVTIASNVFKNSYLVLRGDVRGATINGNTLSDFQGVSPAIYVSTQFGIKPSAIVISNNTIRDPLTTAPSEGVIVARSPSAVAVANIIMGIAYTSLSITGVGEPLVSIANYVEKAPDPGRLQGGASLINGTDNYWGWEDTGGGLPRMYLQVDNNWIWQGSNASGGDRAIASMQMRSNSSEFRWSVPTFWNNYTRHLVSEVAAAGTTIGTATVLTDDTNNVTSCTVGVADGVSLFPVVGQRQTVINSTANTLKVYPNPSGSAQIDAGGASIPTTIAAGKSKTFTSVAAGDFRTIAAT